MLLIGFAGSLELNRSPGLDEATGEESMSDDPDFPKANHALQAIAHKLEKYCGSYQRLANVRFAPTAVALKSLLGKIKAHSSL
jgi:hypothetical protein